MIKKFLNENKLIFLYIACITIVEFSAQAFVGAGLYFTKFWITLLFLFVPLGLLFSFKSLRLKKFFSMLFLLLQITIVVGTNYLYNATGTVFQKEMIYQRNDAFGTIEQLNVSFGLIFICLAVLVFYITVQVLDRKKRKKLNSDSEFKPSKGLRAWALAICIICLCTFSIMPILDGVAEKNKTDYHYKLLSNSNGTQMYGSTTNIFYELVAFGASSGINTSDMDKLENFLYAEEADISPYHGVSEGNNLIMILVESLDTHVLERYSKEETAKLFPNLTRLIDDGIYATNFRQKEKTDSSEVFSLIASYPTEKYVNYGYEKNAYPFALPNLFKQKAEDNGVTPQVNSFHHNAASFYNRDKLHRSFGFDKLFGINEMLPYGMINDWDPNGGLIKGERSLDSLAMETMKDEMFPVDKNFFSYWITFTMHGFYDERENLKEQGYYSKLDEYGLYPAGNKNDNYLRTYAATVMDFDKSLGIMMSDLESKNLLDNTTIVLFSDHNTYYNNLTEYAKKDQLKGPFDTEEFRIPLIIYDRKLSAAIEENGEDKIVEKFTTTTDIVPTICDLFGIKIWKNMYLGGTIFNKDIESIVYSKMYNFFFNDKMAFYTIDDLRYKSPDFVDEDLNVFIEKAKIHLDKLYFMDKVFYTDYYAKHEYRQL